MTNPISQAAIDAAATALHAAFTSGRDEEPADYEDEAITALEAAMPHIRAQIAEEIRYGINEYSGQLIERAARIAEGENK